MTVTLTRVERSNALDSYIAELGLRLHRVDGRIAHGHWDIAAGAAHGAWPIRYQVKLHLQVPGAQIHAENPGGAGDAELHQALRAAYENAKRQLEDLMRDRRAGG